MRVLSRGDGRERVLWLALAIALLSCLSAPAAARADLAISATPSTTMPYYACPHGGCETIVDPPAVRTAAGFALPDGGPLLEGSGEMGGYSPEDLRSAYKIPASGGAGVTVAIVDAFGFSQIETDLATYRERYDLGSCTKEDGCLKVVNQEGNEAPLPSDFPLGWTPEQALDVDMVSALCPECHILLVEASDGTLADLAAATNEAAQLGASVISNSYGFTGESECGEGGCEQYLADYDQPGIDVVAGAGDDGYKAGVAFPAESPNVIAVGGTNLHRAHNSRKWRETAWDDTGSGCSTEAKPPWQKDKGCAGRTDNDVAAVASPETPVSSYQPYGGWRNESGTSAATAILAGIMAHSGSFTRSLGAQVFYEYPDMLFDVTKGKNGECGGKKTRYLCTAKRGYDGPTGWGTPDGVIEAPEP
ncbi:MAG TPA: S53 family peptidase [Solirubrobacteraceae bacterium]|nr:S53 family peptidase [Solirubrobacteraceae bacterium]